MIRSRYIVFALLFVLIQFNLSGQSLRGLSENQVIKKLRDELPLVIKSTSAASENTLPFFEDFSTSDVFPDPLKWEDSAAFINSSFPVDPISVGVATLDAIDKNGNVYALNDFPTSSDNLTTRPFNLQPYAGTDDVIILSFFYQSGGNGEVPEIIDSLLLEFYSPNDGTWITAWYATEDTFTVFEQVVVPVPELYYQDGFRFRFRNYTSMSPKDVVGGKGALSNVDCWNIDYIMMNTGPVSEHQSIQDITLVDPPRYLMDFYEVVPWSHLNDAQSITRNMLHYVIRNLELTGDSVNVGRSYYVKDRQSGDIEYAEQSYGKFGPNSLERRNDPFFAPFTNSGVFDEGILEVAAYLITPASEYKFNDTSKTILHFRNYYAYDDGIPEYGFGISGESSKGSMLAYRFRIYKPDTLQAIDIFFNKTRDHFTTGEKFLLCIWADDQGEPGEMLFISQEELSPDHKGFLEPVRYPIHAGIDMFIEDTVIYIGWKQLTEEFLNVGYDVNRNSLDKIFVNITGDWFNPGNSIIPGSLMIRPVFGEKPLATHTNAYRETDMNAIIYPNPAKDRLYIRAGNFIIARILIYDNLGKLVYSSNYHAEPIDVTSFHPGIYFIQIIGEKGNTISKKIIISH